MVRFIRILGIISVVAVFLTSLMRVFYLPLGGVFLTLSVGFFVTVVLGLELLHKLRQPTSRLQKALELIAILFLGQTMILGLCVAYGWNGASSMIMNAALLLLVYGLTFFIGKSRLNNGFRFHTPFNGLAILVLLPLLFFCTLRFFGANESKRLVELNEIEVRRYDSVKAVVMTRYAEFLSDTTRDSARTSTEMFRRDALALIDYIYRLQIAFAYETNNGIAAPPPTDTTLNLQDPLAMRMTHVWFIGSDVQNPTGKAIELFDSLAYYRNHVLHEEVPFFVRKNSTQEDKVQWVKDNFYNATAIEVMTRLTLYKENVYQSMQYSIDHHLFVQRQ